MNKPKKAQTKPAMVAKTKALPRSRPLAVRTGLKCGGSYGRGPDND